VRAAELDELLAPERHAAVAAVARAHVHLGFIEEFHDARYAIADAEIRERARMVSLRATLKQFSQKLAGRDVSVGRGHGGPCLTDAAQQPAPDATVRQVCRYASARTLPLRSSRPK